MPSSSSSLLKVELQAAGENNNTWGTKANGSLSRLEEGIAATTSKTMAGSNITLDDTAFSANEARSMVLNLSGTNATIIIPNRSKMYFVKNGGSGVAVISTGSGTTCSVASGSSEWVYCNGSNAVYPISIPASRVTGIASVGTAGALDVMTAAQFRANTADKVLDTDSVWSAADYVSLTDAATVAVDMSTFINATVTLGGNRTLGNPSNTKNGQSGLIEIIQDGTGSRTLAYASNWKFAGGAAPVLTTTAGARDLLWYQVKSSTVILAGLLRDFR